MPKKPPVKAFPEEQARRFLAVAQEDSRLHHLYLTGFLAGCRLGELCGLQPDDDRWDVVNGKRVRQLHIGAAPCGTPNRGRRRAGRPAP